MHKITFNNTQTSQIPNKRGSILDPLMDRDLLPVFSGKTALSLVLAAYRANGKLSTKAGEVLVPPWLGYWVYMIMHKHSFPSTSFTKETKGLLLYHQWGFPQHVEEVLRFAKKHDLFVIEDCAHAFESYSKGERLGTFGDAAIFSFAKFFPCVVGGGVYSRDKELLSKVKQMLPKRAGILEQEEFHVRRRYDRAPNDVHGMRLEQSFGIYDRVKAPIPLSLAIVRDAVRKKSIAKRKHNAEILRSEFAKKDTFGLWNDDVAPWIVPLFFGKTESKKIVAALTKAHIESGIFHFDVRRNMLNPDYQECIAVPCHDGITEAQMGSMLRIIHDAK